MNQVPLCHQLEIHRHLVDFLSEVVKLYWCFLRDLQYSCPNIQSSIVEENLKTETGTNILVLIEDSFLLLNVEKVLYRTCPLLLDRIICRRIILRVL